MNQITPEISWYSAEISTIITVFLIPLGLFILQILMEKFLVRRRGRASSKEERFDNDVARGIPEISGFALIFVGLTLQIVVAIEAETIAHFSQVYKLFTVSFVNRAMLTCGIVILLFGLVVAANIFDTEIWKRLIILREIMKGRRPYKELSESACPFWRAIVSCLGMLSVFIPLFVVFGQFIQGR
jgi:hypothetical protein